MSTPFLIVDGYNLLHAAGLARTQYGPGDLARKRMELLFEVSRRLTIDEKKRCTVVFDAIDAPKGLSGHFRHHEILVRFPKPGHEADELIENLVAKHSSPRQLTVVSSDRRLQAAIRKRKGIAIDSEDFLKRPIKTDVKMDLHPTNVDTTSQKSNSELDFWLEEFGEIHPDEIQSDLENESGGKKSDWERQVDQLQQRLNDPKALDDWLGE